MPATRVPEPVDQLIMRKGPRYEDAAFLQRLAEHTHDTALGLGQAAIFGVSGWIVAPPVGGWGEGFALVSTLQGNGFQVVFTPYLGGGRRGHVTIVLRDPVDEDQAEALNRCFGRIP